MYVGTVVVDRITRTRQKEFVQAFLCKPRTTWNEVGLYLHWRWTCACVCAVVRLNCAVLCCAAGRVSVVR